MKDHRTKPSFFTLLLLISFAAVNAVLFTPALPQLAYFFGISEDIAQHTITWFLIGYTLGQLIYGPITNRFGRKPTIYLGISLQIISSLLCVLSAYLHAYWLLILGRFLTALGSGVGLKMTFTLVNESEEPRIANQQIAYLTLAFAITPGLAVALGGILVTHYAWTSCFYAGACYGLVLLALSTTLPESDHEINLNALKINYLLKSYLKPFCDQFLVGGGLLMGFSTSFIYVFAAVAPFVAINLMGMTSASYGFANILPAIGLIMGGISSAQLAIYAPLSSTITMGIIVLFVGTISMMGALFLKLPPLYSLFIPMMLIYFGLSLIIANASTIAMSRMEDKAYASSVMNFINMGLATFIILLLGFFPIKPSLLPLTYLTLCIGIFIVHFLLIRKKIHQS